jgi:hypothetical protein
MVSSMAVMGSPHGSVGLAKNKLTLFEAHCPFNPLLQLAESKDLKYVGARRYQPV